MNIRRKIMIARSEKRDLDMVLSVGEPFYCITTEELLIGNGKDKVKDLKGISNIILGEDGKFYTVEIDNNGKIKSVIPLIFYKGHTKYNIDDKIYEYADMSFSKDVVDKIKELRNSIDD